MYLQENPTTYLIIQTLGSGATSTVKLGIDQKGQYVAIKQYKPCESDIDLMLNQVKILKSLNHPNIVQVVDWKQNAILKHKNGQTEPCWAMIMEHFDGGQLWDVICYAGGFSEKIVRTYFLQIIGALNYMHQKGYAHRDIKPTNVMFSDRFELKIVDFGFSCLKNGNNGTGVLNQRSGTVGFQAPQILNGKYEGQKVDIFATGVTLFLMFAGGYPFDKPIPKDDLYKFIIEKNYEIYWECIEWDFEQIKFSQEFKNLLQRMIAHDPKDRITISEILKHSWVKGNVASQAEIYQELCILKQIADKQKQRRKLEEGKHQQQHMYEAMNIEHFSSMRGSGNTSNELIDLINQEMKIKRSLSKFQEAFKHDIVLQPKTNLTYLVARLKHLLKTLQIDLKSSNLEPINYAVVTRDNLLQLKKIKQKDQNKIQASFEYRIETKKRSLRKKVRLIVNIGQDEKQRTVFRLIQEDGGEYPFRRILDQVKNTFAYATDQI